jgi:hypothetical protein
LNHCAGLMVGLVFFEWEILSRIVCLRLEPNARSLLLAFLRRVCLVGVAFCRRVYQECLGL